MSYRIYLQHPEDLERRYFNKDEADDFLRQMNISDWRFLLPFREITFTVFGFQELPGHGILEDGSTITIHYERN